MKSSLKYIAMTTFFLFILTSTNHPLVGLAMDPEINLIDDQHIWSPYSAAIVTQNASDLTIIVSTNYSGTLFNRAYLPIQITSDTKNSLLFSIQYIAVSHFGNAAMISEIRDNDTNEILWSTFLNNTTGQASNETFNLPSTILNKPLEFRFYIWTNGPGEHILDVKNAFIALGNKSLLHNGKV